MDVSRRAFLARATAGLFGLSRHRSGAGVDPRGAPVPISEVRLHRGQPTFHLLGRPHRRPHFHTYVPETRYLRQFADAGTEVFHFSTNLGPGFGPATWVGPGEWDFRGLDAVARRVLEACPGGWLLPRIHLSAPAWWVDAHPEECQVLSDGTTRYRPGTGHGRDDRAFPSLASQRWRADTAAALRHLIRHMETSDYGSRLFGCVVTGLMSEEWYHWSIHTSQLSDYSPHALRAFREWLRARYGDAAALRRAWNDPAVDFDSVRIPSRGEREAGRGRRTFRSPESEMPVIDWYLFYNDLVPDTVDVFLRAAREALGHRRVVGAFYCYMFEFGGDPEYGHNALGRLLRSPHLDFVVVTASYHDRAPGRGADYARAPITSVGLHGKLWYHDNDTVSFRYDEVNAARPDRDVVARYRVELGVTDTLQETVWQYRRGAGFVLGHGIQQGFFDLHGGYYDHPELLAEVGRLGTLLAGSTGEEVSSAAQILVVSDEVSCSYATFGSGFLQQVLQPAQVRFAKIGAPHDSVLLDDLGLVDMDRYRLVVFLNCFHMTDAHRELVRRRVLGRGRMILWGHAPGWFNGATRSEDAMRRLTGLPIIRAGGADPVRLLTRLTPGGMELLDAGRPADGPRDPDRPEASAAVVGHEHVWADLFHVREGGDVSVLGRLDGRREATLALRPMDGWVSVYTSNPVLPSALLRGLARRAGAHVYLDRDDTFYASRGFLCVGADGEGPRTLRFPRPTDLFDPFSGTTVARRVTQYTRMLQDRETLLLRHSS